ncbi:aminoglycoside phosphotransferase [Fomitopsis betulina]|nr:aminoglycoside phosphotransferase [Fomitopsis betulina]
MSAHFLHKELQPSPELPRIHLPTVRDLPVLPNSSPLGLVGSRRIYEHSPTTLLKVGAGDHKEEGVMTALAHSVLGPVVPQVFGLVSIADDPRRTGLLLSRQHGKTAAIIWPSLTTEQRAVVKSRLCDGLVRMRKYPFSYYGRPGGSPYATYDEFSITYHDFCSTRAEWNESRIRALHKAAPEIEIDETRCAQLEKVQRETVYDDRPVLAHRDLSDRNILIDPDTLEVTGIIDWENAAIMPAHHEYAEARLSGGYTPEWRKEILEVLSNVLRAECAEVDGGNEKASQSYERELAAWNKLVDVERAAQGYSDACYWTFESDSKA